MGGAFHSNEFVPTISVVNGAVLLLLSTTLSQQPFPVLSLSSLFNFPFPCKLPSLSRTTVTIHAGNNFFSLWVILVAGTVGYA